MGKQGHGILDGFRGKMDGLVGRKQYNKSIIQRYNDRSGIVLTQRQLDNQTRMRLISNMILQMPYGFTYAFTEDHNGILTPDNIFIKRQYRNMNLDGSFYIDGETFIQGRAGHIVNFAIEPLSPPDTALLTFKIGAHVRQYIPNGYLVILFYCVSTNTWENFSLFIPADDGASFIVIPDMVSGQVYQAVGWASNDDNSILSLCTPFQFTWNV